MNFLELKDNSKKVLEGLEKQPKRKMGKHDEEEREKQERLLINQISHNVLDIKEKIAVFNNECSFGKTYIALKGAIKYIADSKKSNFDGMLFCCERIEECEINADIINGWFKKFTRIKESVAIAIEPAKMSRKEIKENLENYSFVFITHAKYRKLIINELDREIYIENRGLLIIDEYIDLVQPIEFSKTYNALLEKDVKILGGNKALELYKQIVRELNNEIFRLDKIRDEYLQSRNSKKRPPKFCFFNAKTKSRKIEGLIIDLCNIIKNYSDEIKLLEYQKNNDWVSIFDKIKELENFYLGTSVAVYGKNKHTNRNEQLIYVPSYYLSPFLLKNSILLDASAELNLTYKYQSKIYQLITQKKIFDHSNYTITVLHINGTKYAQENKYENYKEASRKIIKELRNEEGKIEKTLVVTKKENCVNSKGEQVYIYQNHDEENFVTYYELLKSNNSYKDFQNCFLETLYMPPPHLCILKYLFFTNRKVENGELNTEFYNCHRVGMFRDNRLEEIRKFEVANWSYQAIKRIDRDRLKPNCKIVWNCHYNDVISSVKAMMIGCKITDNLQFQEYYKIKPKKVKDSSVLGKLKSLCTYILNSNIPKELENKTKKENNIITLKKKDISEYLNIESSALSRLLKDVRFIEYATSNNICYTISKDVIINADKVKCNNREIKFII